MPEEIVVTESKTAPASPETFSREYVTELRNESKGYRLKAQEQEAKVQAAEAKAATAATEAEARVTTATQAANDRILRAELKAAALKAGMIDLDGLKLADLTTVKLNEAGEVEGADALMTTMKETKPYLFQSSSTTTQTQTPPAKKEADPVDARKMDKAQLAALERELTGKK